MRALSAAALLLAAACQGPAPVVSDGLIPPAEFPVSFRAPALVGGSFIRTTHGDGTVVHHGIWAGGRGGPRRAVLRSIEAAEGHGLDGPEPPETLVRSLDTRLDPHAFQPAEASPAGDGVVTWQRFGAGNAHCVAFARFLRLRPGTAAHADGDAAVHGYYCAPEGALLDDMVLRSLVGSVTLRGR